MILCGYTKGRARLTLVIISALAIVLSGFVYAWSFPIGRISYTAEAGLPEPVALSTTTPEVPVFRITHISTPRPLKAVYMTSWAAGNKKFREELFDLVDTTEINAVVIDVKDYTGRISFPVDDPDLQKFAAAENRIPDIKEFIGTLHDKGVYVIGRISSFQDSFLIKDHPEWAVKTREGNVWQDYKGVKWLDAGAKPVWDYLAAIGRQAHAIGFDELNFDYIRYPSDGDLEDIVYMWSDGRPRYEVMREFFAYLHGQFSGIVPISIDLFGLTTSATGDLGIGQVMELALPYFDYVAPMVYPSHFGYGFNGYPKPAEHPYEVVKYSMDHAITKAEATTTPFAYLGTNPISSTTPQLYSREPQDGNKLRPWLQSFDLGAVYTPAMIRAQIQATYDAGLTSWMLWHAGSIYKKDSLVPKAEITK